MKRIIGLLLFLNIANIAFAQQEQTLKWWNPSDTEVPVISGQAWPNEVASISHRLPARAEKDVRVPVWNLSKQSAGLSIRFWTNAKNISVRYKVKGNLALPHMPATGVSGVDLYSKTYHGEWARCWGTYSIKQASNYEFMIDDNTAAYKEYGREYQLFLPLYNEVDSLEIGVEEESFFIVQPLRKEKPIVAYGTSICQGACASRPGMAWTNILERKLERPVINLGFSGNGRLEPELIELMAEIDAKLYILDCLPNIRPDKDDAYQLTLDAVKKLKEKRPTVPIILTAHIGYANNSTNRKSKTEYLPYNKALNRALHALKAAGYTDIFLLQEEELGLDFDSYVDYIHPNDVGMVEYADAYEQLIRKILKEKVGSISTTIPKTQSRDISVYKWEDRHQEILELNKIDAPKICLFGNSITHFWGGAPKANIARGQDSWESIMKPRGIRNFGYGWDRIENVLWRIYHDELTGFEAEKIIFMIGTNNLHLNTDKEIIGGLEALINAVRIRQPKADILFIGILPRTAQEERVKRLNLKISELADIENIDYADIGQPLLLADGKIDASLFTDGLHPNKEGYRMLAGQFQQILQQNKKD